MQKHNKINQKTGDTKQRKNEFEDQKLFLDL